MESTCSALKSPNKGNFSVCCNPGLAHFFRFSNISHSIYVPAKRTKKEKTIRTTCETPRGQNRRAFLEVEIKVSDSYHGFRRRNISKSERPITKPWFLVLETWLSNLDLRILHLHSEWFCIEISCTNGSLKSNETKRPMVPYS